MNLKKSHEFLTDLRLNNDRDWFQNNKDRYLAAKAEFEEFVTQFILIAGSIDTSIGALSLKDAVFRLYRDIRFSNDKTPYKTHFGAYVARGGRKSRYAGYYIHVEPGGNSFFSGGIYMPAPEDLKAIRSELYYNFDTFKEIIENPSFSKAFREFDEEKLKKVPNGFDKNHPSAEYLKYKSISFWHALTDKEIVSDALIKKLPEWVNTMKPLNDFINESLD